MCDPISLDSMVRNSLKLWPQRPPGMRPSRTGRDAWLRARPPEGTEATHPFLRLPGSNKLRTLPDGLWLNFGGTPEDPFVDILAVEACATMQNLLDKRSRFAPSTQSTLAVCPVAWLVLPVAKDEPMPRWKATGLLKRRPTTPLTLPVRDMRVLYGLREQHYVGFSRYQLPHAHEFFVPIATLTAHEGDKNPALRALLFNATPDASFLSLP
jgi:hypothetical protein